MGTWKYLRVKVRREEKQEIDSVISVDDEAAGEKILNKLADRSKPLLSDFLIEAGKQEWELVSSKPTEAVLRKYVSD